MVVRYSRGEVKSRGEKQVTESVSMLVDHHPSAVERCPEHEDTSSMIVALRFDICVDHQGYGKDDDHNVPTREDMTSIVGVI